MPEPRRATALVLRASDGSELDRVLALWMPGPGTATGEDLAELHLHGGRAVVTAVEGALGALPGFRRAEAGEFTRRAFANGRIDLAEAEGLADLLAAETESQRRSALAMAGGALSREVEGWRDRVLALSAAVEAVLDFGDEDDVETLPADFGDRLERLGADIGGWLSRPSAERLRDGIRVVLAGPANAGKSSLFNALLDTEAAIVTSIPGTTRDVIERPVAVDGTPFVLVDTAGLRADGADAVEAIGVGRAQTEMARADLVLWLGDEGAGPQGALEVAAKSDLECRTKAAPFATVSATTGQGVAELWRSLVLRAREFVPLPGEVALNRRHRAILSEAIEEINLAHGEQRALVLAENLRQLRVLFDRLLGGASTEDMLDALFGRFCIGK